MDNLQTQEDNNLDLHWFKVDMPLTKLKQTILNDIRTFSLKISKKKQIFVYFNDCEVFFILFDEIPHQIFSRRKRCEQNQDFNMNNYFILNVDGVEYISDDTCRLKIFESLFPENRGRKLEYASLLHRNDNHVAEETILERSIGMLPVPSVGDIEKNALVCSGSFNEGFFKLSDDYPYDMSFGETEIYACIDVGWLDVSSYRHDRAIRLTNVDPRLSFLNNCKVPWSLMQVKPFLTKTWIMIVLNRNGTVANSNLLVLEKSEKKCERKFKHGYIGPNVKVKINVRGNSDENLKMRHLKEENFDTDPKSEECDGRARYFIFSFHSAVSSVSNHFAYPVSRENTRLQESENTEEASRNIPEAANESTEDGDQEEPVIVESESQASGIQEQSQFEQRQTVVRQHINEEIQENASVSSHQTDRHFANEMPTQESDESIQQSGEVLVTPQLTGYVYSASALEQFVTDSGISQSDISTATRRSGLSIDQQPHLRRPAQEPMYPQFVDYQKRVRSFSHNNNAHWPRKEDLVLSGFFYAGRPDCVRCFHCGGGLYNWNPGDDPWTEHARWFPRCYYLNQMRRVRNENMVQQATADLQPEGDGVVSLADARTRRYDRRQQFSALRDGRDVLGAEALPSRNIQFQQYGETSHAVHPVTSENGQFGNRRPAA